jgi:uncharacterized protein
MKRATSVAIALALSVAASSALATPSFNCRYAKWADEVAICSNRSLAAADTYMAQVFYTLRNHMPRTFLRDLDKLQHDWLRARHRCGADNECIRSAYMQRLHELYNLCDVFGVTIPMPESETF